MAPPRRVTRRRVERIVALVALAACATTVNRCWTSSAPRGMRFAGSQRDSSSASAVVRQASFAGDADGAEKLEAAARLLLSGPAGKFADDVVLPEEVEQLAQRGVEVLPQLPPWADSLVGIVLTIFPIVVVGNWLWMMKEYNDEKQANNEEYERQKVKKALEFDPDDGIAPGDMPQRRKKRKKATALQEAMALDKEDSARRNRMY